MRYFTARVADCQDLGGSYSWLSLAGCAALADSRPGQFVMLRGAEWGRDPLLPRAFSLLWVEGDTAELLVRRVGRGSALLGALRPGAEVSVLGPLGNSFPDPDDDVGELGPPRIHSAGESGPQGRRELLVAGGCGLAPLYHAARRALARGRRERTRLLLGARQSCDLVLVDRLLILGLDVLTATEDGSAGARGLVTELLEAELHAAQGARPPRVLACGPEGMLRATRDVARRHQAPCFLSLEAPMACGMGLCLGCAVPARDRPFAYVCQDGPIFPAEEVWP